MLDCKHHTKMKPFVRRLLGAAVSVAVLYSCASVGRLEGGPIDEEPPRFVTGSPLPGALHNKRVKSLLSSMSLSNWRKPMKSGYFTSSSAATGNKGKR